MSDFTLTKHTFDNAKNQLKVFSEQTQAVPELSKVDSTGGLFGWFDHKVTGDELNELTAQIQEYLIDLNNLSTDFIKQIGGVYQTFEALDQDYMQGIIIAIKGVESNTKKIQTAQNDIKNTIVAQKKIIEVLSNFKERLEKYKHLEDIDDIWNGFRKTQRDVIDIGEDVSKAVSTANNNAQDIKTLYKFKEKIDRINHINDVDILWEDLQIAQKSLPIIEKQIEDIDNALRTCADNLSVLIELKKKIDNIRHIYDVDVLWDDFQKAKLNITSIMDDVTNIESKLENSSASISTLLDFKKKLDEIKHIDDLDKVCDDVFKLQQDMESAKRYAGEIKDEFISHNQSIHKANDFIEKCESYEHLNDVDVIWDKCSSNENDIKNTKEDCFRLQKQFENLQTSVSELQNNIDKSNKKLTLAYAFSGISIGIAVIEFLLLILR